MSVRGDRVRMEEAADVKIEIQTKLTVKTLTKCGWSMKKDSGRIIDEN